MEVYLTSYEYKLVNVLLFHFPTVAALVGKDKFPSQLALPYIQKCPPKDWDTETFSRDFVPWLKKTTGRFSPLLLPIADIDLAFLNAHFPVKREGCLHEDVQVVESDLPLIELRKALLQGLPLPSYQKKKRAFVVFADQEGKLFSREEDPFHGKFLRLMTIHSFEKSLELLVQDKSLPLDSLELLLPTWGSVWGELRWIDEKKLS